MSVSGISTVPTNNYQSSGAPSEFQRDFRALVRSLKSGDLSGAQQAYKALSQLPDGGQGPSANSNSRFSQALNQIGQALQNSDLSGAQQALSSLQQARGHHHHGQHGGGESTTSAGTTPPSSSASLTAAANELNITA